MKNLTVFILLFILFLPMALHAQWKRETGFTVGITSPEYPKDFHYYEKIGISMKLGFAQSWYKPKPWFSLRPEVGFNIEILPITALYHGGLGGGTTYDGTIVSIIGELATLAQIRITKRLTFAIGPAGKYLLTNITKMTNSWFLMHENGVYKINGFNRRFLNKPSIGIKAMIIEKNLSEKVSLGLSVEHHRLNTDQEEMIDYSETTEVSFYLGLH
jgi:hypothetical protein